MSCLKKLIISLHIKILFITTLYSLYYEFQMVTKFAQIALCPSHKKLCWLLLNSQSYRIEQVSKCKTEINQITRNSSSEIWEDSSSFSLKYWANANYQHGNLDQCDYWPRLRTASRRQDVKVMDIHEVAKPVDLPTQRMMW